MFGLSKFANKNKIETKGRDTQTFVSVSVEEICTVSMCVTTAFSPFGKQTQE